MTFRLTFGEYKMAYEDHIVRYLDGISLVEASVKGLSDKQLKTRSEPGKWSIPRSDLSSGRFRNRLHRPHQMYLG